jgi:hypothetical protein
MSDTPVTDSLPPALREVRTRPLLAVRLAVRGPMPVIATPARAAASASSPAAPSTASGSRAP